LSTSSQDKFIPLPGKNFYFIKLEILPWKWRFYRFICFDCFQVFDFQKFEFSWSLELDLDETTFKKIFDQILYFNEHVDVILSDPISKKCNDNLFLCKKKALIMAHFLKKLVLVALSVSIFHLKNKKNIFSHIFKKLQK